MHLRSLREAFRPGAVLAYVVGDQCSYLRVKIETGKILAEIADSLGYEVTGLDLFRTRMATATREQLREEVLLLRWDSNSSSHGADQEFRKKSTINWSRPTRSQKKTCYNTEHACRPE